MAILDCPDNCRWLGVRVLRGRAGLDQRGVLDQSEVVLVLRKPFFNFIDPVVVLGLLRGRAVFSGALV